MLEQQNTESQSEEAGGRVENAKPDSYNAYLNEPGRPPSRGGNTRAWHAHVLVIEGTKYSFLALGARKWVFAGDMVSFEWRWNSTRNYRNILRETVQVVDKSGKTVVRGLRGDKPRRTAPARMPVSRREMRD